MRKSLSFIWIVLFSTAAWAQDQPAGKVHGYVFGDYYYKMSGDKSKAVSGVQYADSALTKTGGFQLRRIYLYYEQAISESFQAQFLLEGNDATVDGKGKHSVFIKLANLEWKNILPDQNLAFGMIGTPTWALSEKIWGYRPIEKTIADMRGLGGASDIGVALKGKFGRESMFAYTAMVSNGNGQKPENDKYKKYYFAFNAKPVKGLIAEVYADYETALASKTKTTLKGFAAYQAEKFTIGLEAVQQIQNKANTDSSDRKPFGISVFASGQIMEQWNGIVRIDMFDPDTKSSKTGYKEIFLTAGIDYAAHKNVHIMPNIWVNSYSGKGSAAKRSADVAARLTFFYAYK